jgi:hypothetical protein
MRAALVVGINHYEHMGPLFGCVSDAQAVADVLERDANGDRNFDCKVMLGAGPNDPVQRGELRDGIEALFAVDAEIALFYFAGHGHLEASGGYILASDARRGYEGVALVEVLDFANKSRAKNKIIVLDSCHSGYVGSAPTMGDLAALAEGVTILTASTQEQYAREDEGRGVFTTLLVDALRGGAANLTGDISPGSVYAHIDQALGAWEQRPVFKTNVKMFVSLRKVAAPIAIADLRRIAEFFPKPGDDFALDPTFEPEMKGRSPGMPAPVEANTRVFWILQQYNRLGLLVPVGAQHMWSAAMESTGCRLTPLGEHYLRLVSKGRI